MVLCLISHFRILDSCDSPLLRKMKRTVIILLLLLAGLPLWAQDDEFRVPDSLMAALEQNPKPDMNRAEALANIIDYSNKNRQHQKAQPYINELAQIADKLNNDYVKAQSFFYQGTILLNRNEYKEALTHLNKGLTLVASLPENERTLTLHARLLNSRGTLYSDIRMNAEGYECFSKGLKISENINDPYLTSMLEINTANILNQIERFDEAIDLCRKNLMRSNDSNTYKHIVFSILAESYKHKSSCDTALMYFDSAFITSATHYDESRCLANRAFLYYDMGDFGSAKHVLKNILDNYKNELFKDAQILTMNCYGYIIGMDSQSDSAMIYIDSAISKAKEYNFPSLEMECYASKSILQNEYGDYSGFSKSIMKYIALRDSLDAADDNLRLEKTILSNEFKKTEEQLRLEKELSDAKNQKARIRFYLIIISLGSVVLILALAFNRRNILLKNKDMELKSKDMELKNADMELKNKQLKEEVLTKEIEARNRELTAKALVQVERQELLTEMIEKLKAIVDDKRKLSQNLNEVINDFEKYKNSATPEDFDYYFTQTNPDFYKHLLVDFPNLTPYEQRLCAFLRLNLNTKDIAAICNISPDSAKVARARLRKSLNLVGSDADLTEFLSKY